MTKLLVSVQNAQEARAAADGGADVIDVKDPNRGSLGAPQAAQVREVIAQVAGRLPLSVACGELSAWREEPRSPLTEGVQFAKFGLAGCLGLPDWPRLWESAIQSMPTDTAAVAVAYADGHRHDAPASADVLRIGAALGCRVALVDTYDKSAGGLLDHWSLPLLARFLQSARDAGMASAVAGSLNADSVARVLDLRPDYVAVRGAVSRTHRAGQVDRILVARLVRQIHGHAVPVRSA